MPEPATLRIVLIPPHDTTTVLVFSRQAWKEILTMIGREMSGITFDSNSVRKQIGVALSGPSPDADYLAVGAALFAETRLPGAWYLVTDALDREWTPILTIDIENGTLAFVADGESHEALRGLPAEDADRGAP